MNSGVVGGVAAICYKAVLSSGSSELSQCSLLQMAPHAHLIPGHAGRKPGLSGLFQSALSLWVVNALSTEVLQRDGCPVPTAAGPQERVPRLLQREPGITSSSLIHHLHNA